MNGKGKTSLYEKIHDQHLQRRAKISAKISAHQNNPVHLISTHAAAQTVVESASVLIR